MKENEINRITEDTLNSIDGLNRLNPDEILFRRIVNSIGENKGSILKENSYQGKYIIAFAVLVMINIFSFFSYKSTEEIKSTNIILNYSIGANDFAKEFFSGQDEYNYNK